MIKRDPVLRKLARAIKEYEVQDRRFLNTVKKYAAALAKLQRAYERKGKKNKSSQ